MSAAPISKLSAHIIAGHDDLLTEILIRLPVKSLLRFKLVSKHWLSLITNTRFCLFKSQILCKDISGLLLQRSSFFPDQVYDFIPLDDKQPLSPPFRILTFVPDESGIKISQSCNGLLLCRSFRVQNGKRNYYIVNPTTKQFTTLPDPLDPRGVQSVHALYLAFDPRKSFYYKAICIYLSTVVDGFEIKIYSSETGLWRHIGDPFSAQVNFDTGVYWNGAINWTKRWGDALYFNVDEERFGTLPMPAVPDGSAYEGRRIRYFGESNDHLHLIEIYCPGKAQFNVYEMDREYSGWFVKYHVDLDAVMNAFPESVSIQRDPWGLHFHKFLVLNLVRREDDKESYIVLSIPGKAVRYNFKKKSFKKLYDFDPSNQLSGPPMIGWLDCFHLIESLMPV